MNTKKPKLNYLSMLVMLNLGVVTLTSAAEERKSNELNEQDIEVITVTGIHASMIKSKDIKRASDGVVDAIAAEDIGKFPDQNVAESLQRISGVAIDREGGEGQLISVRGLGPEFNSVLVNGRTMATISGGRAFSFDTLAAELINGAEVHKTQTGKLQEGSIGATVNITTHKPLDIKEFKAVGSVKSTYDDMSESNNPTFSGLISNTFDDGKFGVLASLSIAKRDSRYDQGMNFGYYEDQTLFLADGSSLSGVYVPQNWDQIVKTESRDRTSGNLILQYAPSDNLTLTADALVSEYDVNYREDILAHWFEGSNIVAAEIDERRTVVALEMGRASATDYLNRMSETPTSTKAFGINADWVLRDNLTVNIDISTSKAESLNGGKTTDTVAGFYNSYAWDTTTGSTVPSLSFSEDLSPSRVRAHWASAFGWDITDEITELKADASYVLDQGVLSRIDFGVMSSDRTLARTRYYTHWSINCAYCGYPDAVDIPDNLFELYDADGFLSGANANTTSSWLRFNSYELFDFLSSDAAISNSDDPAFVAEAMESYGYNALRKPYSFKVNERTTSLYTDFHFDGEFSDMPWSLVAGLRYVETKTKSIGASIKLEDLVDINNSGELTAIESEDYEPVTVPHSYKHLLPSVNANIEIVDDLIARFAYSQSITRPTLTEMSPETGYGGGKPSALTGWGGNPKLKPYESDNIDLSLEWYFDESSYAAVAYFSKDIDNFIEGGVFDESVTVPSGTYDYKMSRPMNLNSAEIDGFELAVQHRMTYLPAPFDGFGFQANMTFVDSESSADSEENPLPLPGLGDSQNAVLYYEKDAIQFRIAYNNRNEFMQVTDGGYGHPVYVDDYAQVDISGSYDINDSLTVFFEGINVTNEITHKRGLFSNHILSITETGPRYAIGIRGSL
ncbi:TonB-dependent receptor [Thalassotalea loyana]|uniref:TonB-dependent receptor n=1 Tax=Thalassotalea loyana TaxID=280483 RepID=A0ABQ6HDD3_9GAMM|nr:TonB-dependent receptor [Thalassotalea loyana]GLX86081.1 TonB-dependent receptor [Thalassotalea loyana]